MKNIKPEIKITRTENIKISGKPYLATIHINALCAPCFADDGSVYLHKEVKRVFDLPFNIDEKLDIVEVEHNGETLDCYVSERNRNRLIEI